MLYREVESKLKLHDSQLEQITHSNKAMRILFASDIHFDGNGDTESKIDADTRANHLINRLNAENKKNKVDAVFFVGDIVQNDKNIPNGHDSLKEIVENYFSQLEMPYYCVHGSHDFYTETKWKSLFGYDKNYTISIGNTVFIMIDNYNDEVNIVSNSGFGYTKTNVEWFNNIVDNNRGKQIIVCSHYLDRSINSEIVNVMKNNNIFYFEGHVHDDITVDLDGLKGYRTGNYSYPPNYDYTASEVVGRTFRELIIDGNDLKTKMIYLDYSIPQYTQLYSIKKEQIVKENFFNNSTVILEDINIKNNNLKIDKINNKITEINENIKLENKKTYTDFIGASAIANTYSRVYKDITEDDTFVKSVKFDFASTGTIYIGAYYVDLLNDKRVYTLMREKSITVSNTGIQLLECGLELKKGECIGIYCDSTSNMVKSKTGDVGTHIVEGHKTVGTKFNESASGQTPCAEFILGTNGTTVETIKQLTIDEIKKNNSNIDLILNAQNTTYTVSLLANTETQMPLTKASAYLIDIINNNIQIPKSSLYSLDINYILINRATSDLGSGKIFTYVYVNDVKVKEYRTHYLGIKASSGSQNVNLHCNLKLTINDVVKIKIKTESDLELTGTCGFVDIFDLK